MDFNFDTGTIFGGLAQLDVTTLPPLGSGPANILTITGSGALTLPKGSNAQRPAAAGGTDIAGMFRYNTGFSGLEYFDGVTWQQLSFASGAVTSFKLDDLSAFPIYLTSPTVSTTGAISATMTLAVQAPNSVFAGPASGVTPLQPGFRALATADIPPVTNISGGTGGEVVYQSAPNTTSFTAVGTTGQILTSNGAGAPTWTSLSSSAVTSFSAGTTGLTPSSATTGAVTLAGTLNVANGGTGDSSLTLNGVMYGNGTSPVNVTAAGIQYNILTVNAGGVPVFGTLNLAQAGTAVTGILPLANGGTNFANTGSNGSIMYNNGSAIVNSTVGTNNQAFMSTGAGAPTWLDVSSTVTTNQILQGNGAGAFTANGGTYVGSPTYSGVTLQGTVYNATDAVTKSYVDAAVAGLNVHGAVETADTGTEITGAAGLSYTAGVAGGPKPIPPGGNDAGTGVGAFLSGTGTLPVIGGYTLTTVGQRVLIKQFADGIYSLGTITPGAGYNGGAAGGPFLVPLTGGTGTGATANITTDGTGAVIGVSLVAIGQNYTVGDVLSASPIGAAGGAGFSIPVNNLQCMQNGIYVVTTLAPNWKLTRASDYDNSTYGDVKAGDFVFVTEGLAKNTGWVQVTVGTQQPGDITKIGTDEIDFTQFSGAGTYTAGAGLSLAGGTQFNVKTDGITTYIDSLNNVAVKSSATGNQVLLSNGSSTTPTWGALPLNNSNAVTGILGPANGGTGLNTSAAANGQLLIGNGAGLSLSTLTAGTGIGVSNGSGTITISNTGVTSFSAGTTGFTPNTATTGAITLAGTLNVVNGGTGQTSFTVDGVLYGNSTSGINATAPGTTGQVLVGNTGGAPTWSTLSGVAVTTFQTSLSGLSPSIATSGAVTLAGTLGIANGGTGKTTAIDAFDALSPTTTTGDLIYNNGTSNVRLPVGTAGQVLTVVTGEPTWQTPPPTGVTSFKTTLSGLTPSVATTGAVSLDGTLGVTSGGTGLSSFGTADQFLSMNAGATAFEYKTISAGTGISVTPGVGVLTIANTGVTSVGLSLPSSLLTVTVSPVTTTGTLTATLTTQANNTVFAGPTTGGPLAPTFRALDYTDLPLKLYKENPSTPTAPVASGANAVAIGSGSSATADGGFAEGDGALARIYGQKAYANGSFAAAGDAQHGVYVLRAQSTTNAYVELFLDGAGATKRIVLPNNSLFTFDILVAGVRNDGISSQGAGYRFVGVAKKDGAGTISYVGSPSKTVIGETVPAWDARLVTPAPTATDSISVQAMGDSGIPVNWVATVLTTEVTF